MTPRAIFGLSVAMSLLSAVVAAVFLAWPRLESMGLVQALIWLIAPHC